MKAQAATSGEGVDYLSARRGIRSWLMSTDHKRIGVMYLAAILFFFVFAATLAVVFRIQLFHSGSQFLSHSMYNRLLTLHGVTMIFLFVIPGIPSVFGNFFLPILIGARDVAFPRLNLASWYCFMIGGLFALISIAAGGIDTGWTFYVPYSIKTDYNILYPMTAAVILGWSSILTGINFVTTVHRMRHPSMGWFRMPLFVWSLYATAWIQILATPIVGITLVMAMLERFVGVALFDPARGGDPILYQHLFWIYSHPAVYIMILPAMGVVSEIIPTFSRKTIFGYRLITLSSIAIALIGSLVWGHHMFTSGMSDTARIVFSFLTFFVAVPSAIKVFNWLATMHGGAIRIDPPMVLALCFILLFSVGGLTGLVNGALAVNVNIHDTSFIVSHFHYTMFGGVGVMFFAALFYWFPKMFGRMYSIGWTHAASALFFVGFNLTYLPLFVAGVLGMPRRYADYPPEYEIYHKLSTVGSWVLFTSILLFVLTLAHALRNGRKAEQNPWGGATPEWRIPSPPPVENFPGEPDMTRGPYQYPRDVEP